MGLTMILLPAALALAIWGGVMAVSGFVCTPANTRNSVSTS